MRNEVKKGALLAVGALALLTGGCIGLEHRIVDPTEGGVIEVRSGDRWYIDLEENATTGYRWSATCDDEDVEIYYEHPELKLDEQLCGAPNRVSVVIRVHRGFAGPAEVRLRYARSWSKEVARELVYILTYHPESHWR